MAAADHSPTAIPPLRVTRATRGSGLCLPRRSVHLACLRSMVGNERRDLVRRPARRFGIVGIADADDRDLADDVIELAGESPVGGMRGRHCGRTRRRSAADPVSSLTDARQNAGRCSVGTGLRACRARLVRRNPATFGGRRRGQRPRKSRATRAIYCATQSSSTSMDALPKRRYPPRAW